MKNLNNKEYRDFHIKHIHTHDAILNNKKERLKVLNSTLDDIC